MAIEYELNEIKIDLATYRHYIRGLAKIGKTTFFRDFIMELYGNPRNGLLLSLGNESGYKALSNIVAKNCSTWYDFIEVVDDLVENKESNEFKFVCIDTVDRSFEIAEKRVLDIHRSIKGEPAFSIDAALGGYRKGKNKAKVLLEEQIARLENAGYGMMYLGHTKTKQIEEQVGEVSYEKVTGSLEFAYDALYSDRADIISMIVYESISKNKELKDQKRVMYFRNTAIVDAGGRIDEKFFPEKIDYSAKGYIETVTKALEMAAGVTGKQADKIRHREEEKRNLDAKKYVEKAKEEKYGSPEMSLEDYHKKLLEIAKSLSDDNKPLKKAELMKQGLPTAFGEVNDFETLKKIHAVLTSEN